MADLSAALQQITNELDRLTNSVVDCLRDIPIAIANNMRTNEPLIGMKVGVLLAAKPKTSHLRTYPAAYEVLRVENDDDATYLLVIDDRGRFDYLPTSIAYPRFTAQGVELDTPIIDSERGKA